MCGGRLQQIPSGDNKKGNGNCDGNGASWLAFFEGFQFVEGAGPVFAQEAGETAVGEDLAVGLALSAVVGLVVGVADALDGLAAGGAGLSEAAVNGHVFAEGCDFFREGLGGFGVEPVDPELEGFAGGGEEALPLGWVELRGLLDR